MIGPSVISHDDVIKIYSLYLSGQSLAQIGKQFNVISNIIKKYLKRHYPNIVLREIRPPELDDPEKLCEYVERDMSYKQIAVELKCS